MRARDAEEVGRRVLRRDDGDLGVTVLDCLAREILHHRRVVGQVVGGGHHLGRGERHDGGDALEAARDEFVRRLHEVGVREPHALAARLELQEQVILFDLLPQRRPRKALAVTAHEDGRVHAREHGGLSRGGLRKARRGEAGVNGDGVLRDEAAQGGTDLGVDGVVRCGGAHAHAVDEEEDDSQRPTAFASFLSSARAFGSSLAFSSAVTKHSFAFLK